MIRQNANFSRENHSENSDSMFVTCNSAQEAFEVFKQFKVMVEKQSGHYIKILRTDRGEKIAF